MISWLRARLAARRLQARFPGAVMHAGSAACDRSRVGAHGVLFPGATLQDSTVGAYSYVQAHTTINNADIGPFCSIAAGATIGLAAHPTGMVSTNPVFYDPQQPLPKFFATERLFTENLPRTTIGADVWIGQGAMIKAGVRVEVGAVIGAGAVVVRDVPAYSIVAGVPARVIRSRFAPDISARLAASRWWELPEAELQRLSALFANPESLLAELGKGKSGAA